VTTINGFYEKIFIKKGELSTGYPQFPLTYPHPLLAYPQVKGIVEKLSTIFVDNFVSLTLFHFWGHHSEKLFRKCGNVQTKSPQGVFFGSLCQKNWLDLSV
jgi:hypothetical protein